MNARKLVLALAAASGIAALAGCAVYPYDYGYNGYGEGYYPNYAYNYPYSSYGWYGPGYYYGPSVSFGLTYNGDEEHHHGHWHG